MNTSREGGQVLVIAAVCLAAILTLASLLINLGFALVEKRQSQNAADAVALAAAWALLNEHTSGSLRDAQVVAAADSVAQSNNLDPAGATPVQVAYVDSSGATVGASGGGAIQFPSTAVGVRVAFARGFSTMLTGFIGPSSVLTHTEAHAGVVPVAFPNVLVNPVPFAAPLAGFQAAVAYDLYDTSVAGAQGTPGYRPFLDLASPVNTGPGYVPGGSYGSLNLNIQYWSDGAHSSGTVTAGSVVSIAPAGSDYAPDVRTGLLDNVRRQGLVDAAGRRYCLVTVPLWDAYATGSPDTVRVAGFALFRLLESDITLTGLSGRFVPFVPDPASASRTAGPFWGPSIVALTR